MDPVMVCDFAHALLWQYQVPCNLGSIREQLVGVEQEEEETMDLGAPLFHPDPVPKQLVRFVSSQNVSQTY